MRVTKSLKVGYIRNKLATVPAWALKALTIVYKNQTDTEKAIERTKEHNGIGFTGTDGEFLSSLAKQFENRGSLSDKQMVYVMKRMKKYSSQVLKVTDERKLVMCMFKDNVLTAEDVSDYENQLFLKGLDKV